MMGFGEEAGVIPKICRDMFERINAVQSDPHLTCTVEVSYLEIYNERVRDLTQPGYKRQSSGQRTPVNWSLRRRPG